MVMRDYLVMVQLAEMMVVSFLVWLLVQKFVVQSVHKNHNCVWANPVYGCGSLNPLLVVPYLHGWPKHIYVRIFFYPADSSGHSRTFPDNEFHMPEVFKVKKLICQQKIGKATFYAQLCPDRENLMPEFFKETICARICPAKETFMQQYIQTMNLICHI